MRWLAYLIIVAYCALLGFLIHDAQNKPKCVKKHAATATTIKPQPRVQPVLRIYYEKDPIPDILLRPWAAQQRVKFIQAPMKFDAEGHWPKDGDLYVVSPRWLAFLQSQVTLAESNKTAHNTVNPAFTSQPFDPDNKMTVPWRWTPYVFYLRHDKDLPWEKNREIFYFREWVNDSGCLWPNDWDLLLGMEIHYQNKSANRHLDNYVQLISELKEKYAAVTAPEEECWQALLDGKIHFTFLPAAYRQKGAYDEKLKDIEIQQPGLGNVLANAFGTIIHLDLLAVNANAQSGEKAQQLIDYLLSAEPQNQLIPSCGYFPVVSKLGQEFSMAPVALPKSHWFNRSEFLINRPPEPPPPPPAPVLSGTETPISPVTPLPENHNGH